MKKQLSFNTKIFKETPKDFTSPSGYVNLPLRNNFGSLVKFGGKTSHAKTKRPLTTKSAIHITLRSSMAKGAYSFLTKQFVA